MAKKPKKEPQKSTKPEKHAGGRPSKYKEEYCDQAYKLCLLGSTDAQLGDFFEVDESTINNWKIAHPGFLESLKRGKVVADAEVAKSLYHRACGYEHNDIHFSAYEGDVTQTTYIKHYPPDTAAAFIWLKNRSGWKDKQQHEHDIAPELQTVLGLINGGTKGKLPAEDSNDSSRTS